MFKEEYYQNFRYLFQLFVDLAGEWYFLETECSFFNYSLFDMLLRLVKSGDVTTHEDVYAKINIDCRTYATRLIDSLYSEPIPAPVIPVLRD